MTTLPQPSGPLGPDERFAILQQELQRAVVAGWTVEGQWPPARAVVARSAHVNHVPHAPPTAPDAARRTSSAA